MPIDYHLHTARCGHASGSMQAYLDTARKRGITEVGFADHVYLYWLPQAERDRSYAMAEEELPDYVETVLALQKQNPDMQVKLGLEVDYIPGQESVAAKIISSLPLDYVIGSVHYLKGWSFDNEKYIAEYQKYDLLQLYEEYFAAVCAAAASGLFDIIAHVDLIKKFGFRPRQNINYLYQKVAQTFAASGVCVEVNTAGLRVPARELYPAFALLQWLNKYHVPVTIGSDAHKPEQVAAGIEQAVQLIKDAGYKRVAVFNRRKRSWIKI